jgi:hypothetical protein
VRPAADRSEWLPAVRQWTPVWQIEVQEGWTLAEVLRALGRMEWQALPSVTHGQVPSEEPC